MGWSTRVSVPVHRGYSLRGRRGSHLFHSCSVEESSSVLGKVEHVVSFLTPSADSFLSLASVFFSSLEYVLQLLLSSLEIFLSICFPLYLYARPSAFCVCMHARISAHTFVCIVTLFYYPSSSNTQSASVLLHFSPTPPLLRLSRPLHLPLSRPSFPRPTSFPANRPLVSCSICSENVDVSARTSGSLRSCSREAKLLTCTSRDV